MSKSLKEWEVASRAAMTRVCRLQADCVLISIQRAVIDAKWACIKGANGEKELDGLIAFIDQQISDE